MACYQCDDGPSVAEIQAARKAQIRAAIDERLAEADAELIAALEAEEND